jgi:hypothetical protein
VGIYTCTLTQMLSLRGRAMFLICVSSLHLLALNKIEEVNYVKSIQHSAIRFNVLIRLR